MAQRLNAVPNINIFNNVRALMSREFTDRIPAMNKTNMVDVSTAIISDKFKAEFNAWQEALINRIGMTIFHEYTIRNKLSKYIYGRMTWGDAIEEIGVGLVKGRTMDYGIDGQSVDPFIKVTNHAKAMYHRINKPVQYETTIEKDRIRHAFLKPYGLSRLLNMFVNSLYSSANLDTWLMSKSVMAYYLNDCLAADGLPLLNEQNVIVQPVTDEASAKAFILAVRNIISAMEFPNNAFNPMKQTKMLTNRDLTLFIKSNILNTIGVEALATAFHINELNLNVKVEAMDDFGIDPTGKAADDVEAVLAEDDWLLITEQFEDLESQYNARGRYINYFLTRAMSFGTTYFKDAVIFRRQA